MRTVACVTLLSLLPWPAAQDPAPPRAVAAAPARPVVALTGATSAIEKEGYHRIQDAQSLARLWLQHRGKPQPDGEYGFFYNDAGVPEVDFERYEVVAIFGGKCVNSAGFAVESIADEPGRRLVRFDHRHYQTAGPDGGAESAKPFAFFVLPRTPLPIVLEEDVQGMINQPPQWKERARL